MEKWISVTGEGAVQKEEDMASHPQQVHCSELKIS
jgi:hypothetical protein